MMRTLIISPNWIGDATMAQPLLHVLRARNSGRPIDVLAPSWVAPVWRAMRDVDLVIETPFKHGSLQLHERWRLAQRLRAQGYVEAYVLPNTWKFALIPWLAGIPRRIGYKGEMRYGLINAMHHDDKTAPRPMVPFYAALADAPAQCAQPPFALPRPTLYVSPEQTAQTLQSVGLQADCPLIAFAPGAEFGSAKRWPATHFAALANKIHAWHPDAQVVLLGSAKDRQACNQVLDGVLAGTNMPRVRNLAGLTTLDQAIALLAAADAVVSNDSGLLHIASALNRPIVALYGPTDPTHAPPFSDMAKSLSLQLDCSPCRQRECPLGHRHCMENLGVEMVWEALREILPTSYSPYSPYAAYNSMNKP